MIPFRVTFRAGVSLFEQVVYASTRAMVSGQLRPGDPFPSVRALSKELKINPNTAHKIVAHLVNEGLLERLHSPDTSYVGRWDWKRASVLTLADLRAAADATASSTPTPP